MATVTVMMRERKSAVDPQLSANGSGDDRAGDCMCSQDTRSKAPTST